jgi:hypothetical protein
MQDTAKNSVPNNPPIDPRFDPPALTDVYYSVDKVEEMRELEEEAEKGKAKQ